MGNVCGCGENDTPVQLLPAENTIVAKRKSVNDEHHELIRAELLDKHTLIVSNHSDEDETPVQPPLPIEHVEIKRK